MPPKLTSKHNTKCTDIVHNFTSHASENMAVTLTRIFQYLDHRDRLETRRICRHWNSTISNWSDFQARVSFKIRRTPAYNSYAIIKTSTVSWKHIQLSAFCISKPPVWYFPSNLYDSLTSLSLLDSTITWLWVKDAIGLFPNLDGLVLKCERKIEDQNEGWFQSFATVSRFVKFQERIRSLELDVKNVSTLRFYLEQFTCPNSKLEELTIKSEPQESTTSESSGDALSDSLFLLIQCCINKLKSLVIETDHVLSSAIAKCLQRLTQEVPNLLVLTVFKIHIRCLPEQADTLPFDANVLRTFLATQLQVESLSCTICNHGSYLIRSERLLLRNLEICGHVPNYDTLLNAFSNLKTLSFHLRPLLHADSFYSGNILSIEGTHPNLQSLSFSGNHVNLETSTLKYNFPNLVKLVILTPKKFSSSIPSALNQFWLQSLIKNLPKLQVLKVSLYANSDYGVSGIDVEESSKLTDTREVYLRNCFQVQYKGVPLSSLKCMKELSLLCSHATIPYYLSDFTDVGIRYGFNFKDLRRLEISVGDQVSNWGLMELARLNPCLEYCFVDVNNGCEYLTTITQEGIQRFKKVLPRARHDRCSVSIVSFSSYRQRLRELPDCEWSIK